MTNEPKDGQAQGRIDLGMNSQVTKVGCIIAPVKSYSVYTYF